MTIKNCGSCGALIEDADDDIMYLQGVPVCTECFKAFWQRWAKKGENNGENNGEQKKNS